MFVYIGIANIQNMFVDIFIVLRINLHEKHVTRSSRENGLLF